MAWRNVKVEDQRECLLKTYLAKMATMEELCFTPFLLIQVEKWRIPHGSQWLSGESGNTPPASGDCIIATT